MAKRKRESVAARPAQGAFNGKSRKIAEVSSQPAQSHIQIIAGSYERILHGIIATVPSQVLRSSSGEEADETDNHVTSKEKDAISKEKDVTPKGKDDLEIYFADSFLFNAHTSAIRCIALSPIPGPEETQKVVLATGSTDEKINLYQISPSPPKPLRKGEVALPSLSGVKTSENAWNRELGSLVHHDSSITALYFPTRSKLISAAEDNTIAVSRTRDWTVLSTIKAPVPQPFGRPSGDTAGPGEVPAGVNDFAVHPSMKLMLTVGKGERCMRLWNLITGKKAGVLSFEREVLQQVGEGKYGTGEGRRIVWDSAGDEFVTGFERGACVYDLDCKPKSKILPSPLTKLHQMHYVPGQETNILAVSTEDGRILFYETDPAPAEKEAVEESADSVQGKNTDLLAARLVAQLGGRAAGVTSRIKDFAILPGRSGDSKEDARNIVIVTGSSDGIIHMWSLPAGALELAYSVGKPESGKVPQVGHLLAQYETNNRITCLKAFIMNERTDSNGYESEAGENAAVESESSDSEESD